MEKEWGREESGWVKADLHLHTSDDNWDVLNYDARELLHRAHELGFRVLAITLHREVRFDARLADEAAELGILLIPGAEVRIDRSDMVVLNASAAEAAELRTFADLRDLRSRRGDSLLCFAPHPYYGFGGSMGGRRLRREIDCIDAIEFCHFHTRWLNPNKPAVAAAACYSRPMLATSDAHQLHNFGGSYSWLRAGDTPTIESVFAAIRADDIRRISPPLNVLDFLGEVHFILVAHQLAGLRKRLQRRFQGSPVIAGGVTQPAPPLATDT